MQANNLKLTALLVVFLCFARVNAQDSIPEPQKIDSIAIDTIVIRSFQDRIKNIPRGANLTNPVISFKRTKPLKNKYNRFKIPSFWDNENKIGFNFSEVAFINWNAGGNNSIAGAANAKFVRNYKFRYVQWNNDLEVRYGLNAQEDRELRKTEDVIRFSSTFGYRKDTITNWYYSVKTNFNTQFSNGYKYPDTETPISTFMAPGYLFLGAGTSYIPEGKKFNLYISPITQKATFVLDQDLANNGSFGVKKAVKDADGAIIEEGENVFMELGFLITNTWEKEIMTNVLMNHRISLYTDYLNSFGNIDVDWELNFNLKVNKYITSNIGTQVIFDNDILFDEVVDDAGVVTSKGVPKIQFKQILGIGITYDF
ncbi:DUF3078 domain-containing protein [Cellulophaga baltica]|uniref:DUF3078 domain-containing protein n=1 Tax=Cellulophaga baltica TaxID=76594 RepID=A0A1G7DFZ2_9FLAO|nr:DUF3078 domain-containing protein [Cellulophaga baltica]SDE50369.1 Protein of unknown function [Cellulophaga baltica]